MKLKNRSQPYGNHHRDFSQSLFLPTNQPNWILQIQNATIQYGNRLLWKDVNFNMHAGEFIALIGANGTGKTSLLKTLLAIQPLTTGKIRLNKNIKIGYVPQLKDFDPKLPIRGRDLVQLGLDGGDYFFGLFNQFIYKNKQKPYMSRKQKHYLVDKAIAEVCGQTFANAPLNMLSGGEQQRMRIAQALVCEPELLLMDEPLLSLDVNNQKIVCDILAHRKQAHQTAIFMISHEILPILSLIDHVIYLHNQQAVFGKPMDILPNSVLFQGYFQHLKI